MANIFKKKTYYTTIERTYDGYQALFGNINIQTAKDLAKYQKALAKEMGLSGIRVNCVAPGMIDTPMNEAFSEEEKAEICSEIPLGRIGSAEECAELIYFLASDEASYITGQTIGINGGWEM